MLSYNGLQEKLGLFSQKGYAPKVAAVKCKYVRVTYLKRDTGN